LNDILWAKSDEFTCYCREVSKATIIAAIARGALTLEAIQRETTACTGRWCEDMNPRKKCCQVEIEALLKVYSKGLLSTQ
jgi:NAD(P)H-nitrite reductase large subunit